MPFLESPRFPERVSFHVTGGPGFATTIVTIESGAEYRNAAWSLPLATYEAIHAVRDEEETEAIRAFFLIAMGRYNGFRYKDWSDFKVKEGQGILVYLTSTTFQLYKRYSLGPSYAGTSTTSLAIATGAKTFTTQAGLSFAFGMRVRASSAANSANYMEGLVASYSSTTLVITVDTIGGSGTLADWNLAAGVFDRKILKPVDPITVNGGTVASIDYTTGIVTMTSGTPTDWTGEFDVPCRFDIDVLKAEILDRSGSEFLTGFQSLPIIELRA